jgi:hypothetical protein
MSISIDAAITINRDVIKQNLIDISAEKLKGRPDKERIGAAVYQNVICKREIERLLKKKDGKWYDGVVDPHIVGIWK